MGGWLRVLLASAALIGAAAAARAQSPAGESATANVQQSRQYEQLLCSNPGFRAKRIAQECGPLQGSQFYQSCLDSFQCNPARQSRDWRQAPPSERIR